MNPEDRALFLKLIEKLAEITDRLANLELGCADSSYKIVIYLVPIFGIVFGSTLLLAVFYWWHKQKLELIRAGIYKPIQFDVRLFSFFLGLLLTFTGLVLSIVFITVLGNSLAMLGGLIPLAIGLSLLTFYRTRK